MTENKRFVWKKMENGKCKLEYKGKPLIVTDKQYCIPLGFLCEYLNESDRESQ